MPVNQYFNAPSMAGYDDYNGPGFSNFGQFVNNPYSTSHYANTMRYSVTPFQAFTMRTFGNYGSPPPGVDAYDYYNRVNRAADRFNRYANPFTSGYGAASAAMSLTRGVASLAMISPGIVGGLGSWMGYQGAGNAAERFSNFAMGTNFNFFANAGGSMGGAIGEGFGSIAGRLGGTYATAAQESAVGGLTSFASKWRTTLGKDTTRMITGAARTIQQRGILGGFGQMLGRGIGRAGTMMGGMLLTGWLMGEAQHRLENAMFGIDYQEEQSADTFERMGNRIFGSTSRSSHRKLGEEIAKGIRHQAVTDVSTSGGFAATIAGAFGVDSFMGRAIAGDDINKRIKEKTAMFGLLGQSGMLGTSKSSESFLKKAEEFEKALKKVSDALGQTATQALDTAKVLASQGIRAPGQMATAGRTTALTSFMTGQSHQQVLAMSSVGTESFRGTGYGANVGFDIAQDVMQRTQIASERMGGKWADVEYQMRGRDSTNAAMIRVMSKMANSSPMRHLLLAGAFTTDKHGVTRLRKGGLDTELLDRVARGEAFIDKDQASLARLRYEGLDNNEMRQEVDLQLEQYMRGMDSRKLMGLVYSRAKAAGYKGGMKSYFVQQLKREGYSATVSDRMAEAMTMDITATRATARMELQQRQAVANQLRKSTYSSFAEKIPVLGGIFKSMSSTLGLGPEGSNVLGGVFAGAMVGGGTFGIPGAVVGGIAGGGAALTMSMPDTFSYTERVGYGAAITGGTVAALKGLSMLPTLASPAGGLLAGAGVIAGALPFVAAGTYGGEKVGAYFTKQILGERKGTKLLRGTDVKSGVWKTVSSAIAGGGIAGLLALAAGAVGVTVAAAPAAIIGGIGAGTYALYNHVTGAKKRLAEDAAANLDVTIGASRGAETLQQNASAYYSSLMQTYGEDGPLSAARAEAGRLSEAQNVTADPGLAKNMADMAGKISVEMATGKYSYTDTFNRRRSRSDSSRWNRLDSWLDKKIGRRQSAAGNIESMLFLTSGKWHSGAAEAARKAGRPLNIDERKSLTRSFLAETTIKAGTQAHQSLENLKAFYSGLKTPEAREAFLQTIGEKKITSSTGDVIYASAKAFFENEVSKDLGRAGDTQATVLAGINESLKLGEGYELRAQESTEVLAMLYASKRQEGETEEEFKVRREKVMSGVSERIGKDRATLLSGVVSTYLDQPEEMGLVMKDGKVVKGRQKAGTRFANLERRMFYLAEGGRREMLKSAAKTWAAQKKETLGMQAASTVEDLMMKSIGGRFTAVAETLKKKAPILKDLKDESAKGYIEGLGTTVDMLNEMKGMTGEQAQEFLETVYKGNAPRAVKKKISSIIAAKGFMGKGSTFDDKKIDAIFKQVTPELMGAALKGEQIAGEKKQDGKPMTKDEAQIKVLDKLNTVLEKLDKKLETDEKRAQSGLFGLW